MELKQVIVVREDLKLSPGKMAAQVAHASVLAAEGSFYKERWLNEQKKVVLKCNTLEELLHIFESAKNKNLPTALIRDAGHTEIPENTITCVGIGPAPSDEIDRITGHLKLL